MKQLLPSCTAMLLSTVVGAQAYVPTLSEDATWDVFHWSPVMCGYHDGGRWFINGDTTIQGQDYKRLSRYDLFHSNPFCPPYSVDYSSVHWQELYLFEDTAARLVFMLDGNLNTDLLYDYSLQIGDTLNSAYFQWSPPGGNVIIDIDTITLLNGQHRKRFHLANSFFYIESIGGSTGIGQILDHGLGVGSDLTCYRQSDVSMLDPLDLMNPLCVLSVGAEENTAKPMVTVTPNPSHGQFALATNAPAMHLQLFDLSGRNVFGIIVTGDRQVVDIRHLRNGIYLYSLDGEGVQGKLVLER